MLVAFVSLQANLLAYFEFSLRTRIFDFSHDPVPTSCITIASTTWTTWETGEARCRSHTVLEEVQETPHARRTESFCLLSNSLLHIAFAWVAQPRANSDDNALGQMSIIVSNDFDILVVFCRFLHRLPFRRFL